jgi:EpsI family protein
MNPRRTAIVVLLLACATAVTGAARRTQPPIPSALTSLPYSLGAWSGADAEPLDAATRRELAADAYHPRTYAPARKSVRDAGAGAPAGLYIAYYAEQRPNASIHSPLHCLPGTGWEPLEVSTIAIPRGDGSIASARRMLIRKDLDRAVVVYWYAVHGRVLANELASKFWLLHDGIRFGRSDAALVRIAVPVLQSVDAADAESVAFARALLPHVSF